MNSRAPSIKFSMEYTCPKDCEKAVEEDHECRDFLNYLDLRMWVDGRGQIQTDLYRKPGTKCQYLRPESAHPRHIFPNIAKSLTHRIVRICSVPGTREFRLQELKVMLLSRGYKAAMLNQVMEYGLSLDRDQALEKVERENTNQKRVRYTITYDPKLPSLPPILVKNWKVMVDTDRRLLEPFKAPPMSCLKRPPNLNDELIRARLFKHRLVGLVTRGGEVGFRRCPGTRRNCALCPFTGAAASGKSVVTEVVVYHSGEVIKLKQNITCKDDYVLYVLSCIKQGCMAQYAGLTSRNANTRFSEHLASTMDPNTTCPVGRHWQLPGHRTEHLQFIPVERVRLRDRATIRQREKDLINTYGFISDGLNIYL